MHSANAVEKGFPNAPRSITTRTTVAEISICAPAAAGRDQLTRRIMHLGQGGSWAQPGDPLLGQSTAHLRRIAGEAAADADALERAAIGARRIDTDGRTVEEAAGLIITQTGWQGRAG